MDKKQLATALTKRLASRKISDAAVGELADDIFATGHAPIDIDVCQNGVCVDYFVDRTQVGELVDKLEVSRNLRGIRLFPKGIIDPDRFLVQVERGLAG